MENIEISFETVKCVELEDLSFKNVSQLHGEY
jgi:hypothetical protein